MDKGFKTFLGIVAGLLVVGIIAAAVWYIWIRAVPFTVTTQGQTYTQNTANIVILEQETFVIEHSDGEDEDIKATLTPMTVQGDYAFNDGEKSYSWNRDIVSGKVDLGEYLTVSVDQESNTITVKGTTSKALERWLYAKNNSAKPDLPAMPDVDMFMLTITSGNTTLKFGLSLRSSVKAVTFPNDGQLYFE